MNDLTVIIPIHRINEDEKDYFAKAIGSIREQKVLPKKLLLVVPKDGDAKNTINEFDFDKKIKNIVEIIENDGETVLIIEGDLPPDCVVVFMDKESWEEVKEVRNEPR